VAGACRDCVPPYPFGHAVRHGVTVRVTFHPLVLLGLAAAARDSGAAPPVERRIPRGRVPPLRYLSEADRRKRSTSEAQHLLLLARWFSRARRDRGREVSCLHARARPTALVVILDNSASSVPSWMAAPRARSSTRAVSSGRRSGHCRGPGGGSCSPTGLHGEAQAQRCSRLWTASLHLHCNSSDEALGLAARSSMPNQSRRRGPRRERLPLRTRAKLAVPPACGLAAGPAAAPPLTRHRADRATEGQSSSPVGTAGAGMPSRCGSGGSWGDRAPAVHRLAATPAARPRLVGRWGDPRRR
jgi:hypothetical protein